MQFGNNKNYFYSRKLMLFLGFFFIFLTTWLNREFGNVAFAQLVYHFQFGAEGLLSTDEKMIYSFIKRCLIFPLLFTILLEVLLKIFSRIVLIIPNEQSAISTWQFRYVFLNFFKILGGNLAPIFLVGSIFLFLFNLSFFNFIENSFSGEVDYYERYYYSPNLQELGLENNAKRNLVLIYLESIELTYSNKNIFERNLLGTIDETALGGHAFKEFSQVPGTNWTIAGIVASQCGIPLKPRIGSAKGDTLQNKHFERVDDFLPGVVCLGDILAKKGYVNVFMGGAPLGFAGKGKFFASHGYHEIYGRDELIEEYRTLRVSGWGVDDEQLIDVAKNKIKELSHKNQPFNLTLLTLDSHGPEGFLSRGCKASGAKDFAGIVECQARAVRDLIDTIKKEGLINRTNIVIMGDHLAMGNPVWEKLRQQDRRYIFNTFVVPTSIYYKYRDSITHFDVFPTIVQSLGFELKSGRLGLGISGFHNTHLNDEDQRSLFLQSYALKDSAVYNKFWLD